MRTLQNAVLLAILVAVPLGFGLRFITGHTLLDVWRAIKPILRVWFA